MVTAEPGCRFGIIFQFRALPASPAITSCAVMQRFLSVRTQGWVSFMRLRHEALATTRTGFGHALGLKLSERAAVGLHQAGCVVVAAVEQMSA